MSLSACIDVPVSTDRRCAFCDYLEGRRPYTILRRTDRVAIMVTREQRGVPHLLVAPIRHCETILDLRDSEDGELMHEIKVASVAISKAFCRAGISVWQNNGIDANQTIPHLHFHVAGTLDEGGTEWGAVSEISLEQTDLIAARLRPFLELA